MEMKWARGRKEALVKEVCKQRGGKGNQKCSGGRKATLSEIRMGKPPHVVEKERGKLAKVKTQKR